MNDTILNSNYFNESQKYNYEISDSEIRESMLTAIFYSFIPIIMQNKNNAKLFLNEENFKHSLSLFELAMKTLPSNENSIIFLSHYLEQAVLNSKYFLQYKNEIDFNDSSRLIKLNYGEIIYGNNNNTNDIIKSDKNHINLFICNRLFNFNTKTYYEVKINKIGNKTIFIGFIDSNEHDYNKAFGFGSTDNSHIFCRKSPFLGRKLFINADEIMANEKDELFKEKDTIGCYYTPEFCYLTINGKLTPYRLSHTSMKTYIPLIIILNDEIELEIVKNVSIVDDSLFDMNKYSFNEKDIKTVKGYDTGTLFIPKWN